MVVLFVLERLEKYLHLSRLGIVNTTVVLVKSLKKKKIEFVIETAIDLLN